MKYFYKYRLFEALGNVLLKAWMTEILLSLLSVAPHFILSLNSSTPSVSYKKTCGFICSLAVFEKVSVQLWDFEKRAPFYYEFSWRDDNCLQLTSLSCKFFFFFCATKDQSETCERVEDALWSVQVSPSWLSAVSRPFTNTFFSNGRCTQVVLTTVINKSPKAPWVIWKRIRGMIQSIYRMMMNRPDALSLCRRCIHVVEMLLQCCSWSLCSHSPIFVPGLVDCGAGQGAA